MKEFSPVTPFFRVLRQNAGTLIMSYLCILCVIFLLGPVTLLNVAESLLIITLCWVLLFVPKAIYDRGYLREWWPWLGLVSGLLQIFLISLPTLVSTWSMTEIDSPHLTREMVAYLFRMLVLLLMVMTNSRIRRQETR
ncbi:hypothetical protein KBC79_06135 [Candidatus Woesebacteria bacterium]|nr:hypothetical protein [Candidatus Woesebacteria bacterium]